MNSRGTIFATCESATPLRWIQVRWKLPGAVLVISEVVSQASVVTPIVFDTQLAVSTSLTLRTWISVVLDSRIQSDPTNNQGRATDDLNIGAERTQPTFTTHTKGRATQLARRELLTTDEVMRLPDNTEILFRAGSPPVLARKVPYFEDPESRGSYDAAR